MLLFFALIYICFGMWGYFQLGGGDLHPFISIGVWFVLMFSSVIVCNEGFFRTLRGQSDSEYIEELIGHKLAKVESYNVLKAITFDDLNTGCLCHILDIGSDKSICLYGQYLYDYTEILDDPEMNQDRSFPTTDFKLVRKVKNGEVLQIDIGETLMDEIIVKDINLNNLYDIGFHLKDGEEICGVPFKKILAAL